MANLRRSKIKLRKRLDAQEPMGFYWQVLSVTGWRFVMSGAERYPMNEKWHYREATRKVAEERVWSDLAFYQPVVWKDGIQVVDAHHLHDGRTQAQA